MKPLRLFGAIAGLAAVLALGGCAGLLSAADSVLHPSSTTQASISNIVAAGESLFTASDKAFKAVVVSKTISVAEAQRLGAVEAKVYAVLVPLRAGVQQGQDVTALYNSFEALSVEFYGDLRADGVDVPIPATPTTAGPAS